LDIHEVREKLREQQGLVTAILGVVIFAALGLFVMQLWRFLNPPPPPEDIVMGYFFDQNTKETFVVPANTPAPMDRPSGPFNGEPAGVKAHVFACGQCSDETKRFVGYIEKPLPPEDRPPPDDPRSEVFLMKRPNDAKWVVSDSREAAAIVEEVFNRCAAGERANFCRPEAQPGK
jgi:hypothetical protein